ncbi:hypothetical protein [Enterococcus faecium]|uniref:hypothetical protein n=1 Tax=Enterococcus faecium TaxID=1352 RepID=UPI0038B81166
MVAKKNTLKEASEKYQDMKRRGLIPKDKKGIWREFVKEVSSDRSGGDFVGRYTAKGYSRRLRITVEYGTNESATELKQRYLDTRREASKKYDDFKSRGLIPKKKKGIWREFFKEEDSDRNKGDFIGRYTAKGYTKNLGIKVEYGTGESSWELRNRYLNTLLEKYKAELLELFDVNDFIEMAEKYGHEEGFMINDIMVIDNFTDLLALAKKARDLRETQMYLFRNKNGRNRRTESSEIEDYYDAFTHDLGAFVDEISGVMNKYRV